MPCHSLFLTGRRTDVNALVSRELQRPGVADDDNDAYDAPYVVQVSASRLDVSSGVLSQLSFLFFLFIFRDWNIYLVPLYHRMRTLYFI